MQAGRWVSLLKAADGGGADGVMHVDTRVQVLPQWVLSLQPPNQASKGTKINADDFFLISSIYQQLVKSFANRLISHRYYAINLTVIRW